MMAMESARVSADVIEANEFPELSRRFRVNAVPKTVVNGRAEILGGLPEPQFVAQVLAAVRPNGGPSTGT
jgi:hypothetical protein